MSAAYLQMFTCAICGRKFMKRVGGFVITPEEIELRTRPICDYCKVERTTNRIKKGIDVLKKILQRKH